MNPRDFPSTIFTDTWTAAAHFPRCSLSMIILSPLLLLLSSCLFGSANSSESRPSRHPRASGHGALPRSAIVAARQRPRAASPSFASDQLNPRRAMLRQYTKKVAKIDQAVIERRKPNDFQPTNDETTVADERGHVATNGAECVDVPRSVELFVSPSQETSAENSARQDLCCAFFPRNGAEKYCCCCCCNKRYLARQQALLSTIPVQEEMGS